MGESSHGVAEFNAIKVRLIKYLHEELDYDGVIFESGFVETSRTFAMINEPSPKEMMYSSIYGTQETLELFKYIQDQYGTNNLLILTGVDINNLASVREYKRPEKFDYGTFLLDWFGSIDSEVGELALKSETEYGLLLGNV
ncbi:hypothetical protein ACW2QC_10905 [Virgibacillus sp. FSP13]